jgi:hypothetical protein
MPGMSTFWANSIINHYLRNQAYTPVATPFLSLHTADPGLTGTNEVTGGSYVRQSIALTAGASSHTDNSGLISFTAMPAVAAPGVVYAGLWDASTVGNFFYGSPLTPASQVTFACTTTAASDLLTTQAVHGLVANDTVEFEAAEGTAIPTGLTAGTIYYVIATGLTTTAFEVSATLGGGAINITTDGGAIVRKVVGKVVNSGDTFQVAVGDYDLTLF